MEKKKQSRGTSGINEPFSHPNKIGQYIKHFQREDREIFARRFDIVASLQLKPTDRVADVGCGTGEFSQLIAPQVSRLFYVDIFPHFLEQTYQQIRVHDREKTTGVLSDGFETGLPPDSLDIVFLSNTYHHFEQPMSMLESIHSALVAGGRLCLIELYQDPPVDGERPHVRGTREEFCAEIEAANFSRQPPLEIQLQSAYFEIFEKREPLEG